MTAAPRQAARTVGVVAVKAAAVTGLVIAARRLGRRSGATDAEVARTLPGDDLVRDAVLVCDRAATFDRSAERVWPWLLQLGKERAGWYFPAPLRTVTDLVPGMRGADVLDPAWQQVEAGTVVPDYGPGDPVFRAEIVDAPRTLVYLSLRDAANEHRWPAVENPLPTGVLALSWGLYLTDLPDGTCRLHLRVRATPGKPWRLPQTTATLAGCVDWLTVAPLFAGLRQRLAVLPDRP